MNSRRVNRGETPPNVFNLLSGQNKYNRYFYLRVGRVVEIIQDRYQMVIEWIAGGTGSKTLPISFPFAGPGSCIGGIPEIGALGIFGFYDEGLGDGSPFCLAYLPSGLAAGQEYNIVKRDPDAISTEDKNLISHRFRSLKDGDVIVSSSLGGQLFVNQGIEIADGMQDSIVLRKFDQSIISTSLNNFVFADGVSVSAGPVIRNSRDLTDSQGNKIPNLLLSKLPFPDGRINKYCVPLGDEIEHDTQFYAEYRIDVDELVDRVLDKNDINSYTTTYREPVVTLAMGNYVGSNIEDDFYGKALRPLVDSNGNFSLVECVQVKGQDEVSNLGLAFAVHLRKTEGFFGMDKQGKMYMRLPASSTADPSGPGKSMSVVGIGSLKEIWGADTVSGNSWDLKTKGGVVWDLGAHNPNGSGRSLDITASRGIKIEINSEDEDGWAKQEIINGAVQTHVIGTESTNASESHLQVDGLRTESIGGSASYGYQADKTENVMGVYTQVVVKEMQGRFFKRKTTITGGNDELTVLAGDISETIQGFGNKKTTLLGAGNIIEYVASGSKFVTLQAGQYALNVLSGGVSINCSAGQTTLSGTSVLVQGTVYAEVSAPKVNLGLAGTPKGAVVTGAPGKPSHLDYLTGLPLLGTATVSAGV